METVCRLCLKPETSISLFKSDNTEHLVADKLREFVNINVSPYDNLPSKVCQNCVVNLDFCIQFVDRCRRVTQLMQNGEQVTQIHKQLQEYYPYLHGSGAIAKPQNSRAVNPQTVAFPQGSYFGPTQQFGLI